MTVARSLTTAPAAPECLICGGATHELPEYAPLRLARCDACEFVFHPQLTAAEVRSLYGSDYFERRAYSFTEAQRRLEARSRLQLVHRFSSNPGGLLEVGASTGFFLAEAAARNWSVTGVEPCASVARWATERHGVNVVTGFIEDVALEPESYDFICGWHVLEHILDPLPVVQKLSVALRPGGHIAFEVPNFGGIRSRRNGPRWQHLAPSVHVGQFSPRSMEALLSRAGLDTCELLTVPPWIYVGRRESWRPRHLVRRARYSLETRSAGLGFHPDKFDLLRVVAQRARRSHT